MIDKIEVKKRAREFAFKNKWNIWKPALCISLVYFVFGFIMSIFNLESGDLLYDILNIIFEIVMIPATIGSTYYLINLINGNKLNVKEALLSKYSFWKLIIVTTIIIGLCTLGWTLLLIIPGILYSFKVIMATNILAENEDENLSFKDIINQSKEMMDGYKTDYFKFMLSFYIWQAAYVMLFLVIYFCIAMVVYNALLGTTLSGIYGILFLISGIGILILSISSIWVVPYMNVSKIMYYQELKKIRNIK